MSCLFLFFNDYIKYDADNTALIVILHQGCDFGMEGRVRSGHFDSVFVCKFISNFDWAGPFAQYRARIPLQNSYRDELQFGSYFVR